MRPVWIWFTTILLVVAAHAIPAHANQVRSSSPGQVAPNQTAPTPTVTEPINEVWIRGILIYHLVAAHWRRTTIVRLGERVRFVVYYLVNEFGEDCALACVPTGTVFVMKNGRQVYQGELGHCADPVACYDRLRLVTRFRRRALVGHLTAEVSIVFNATFADSSVDFQVRPALPVGLAGDA